MNSCVKFTQCLLSSAPTLRHRGCARGSNWTTFEPQFFFDLSAFAFNSSGLSVPRGDASGLQTPGFRRSPVQLRRASRSRWPRPAQPCAVLSASGCDILGSHNKPGQNVRCRREVAGGEREWAHCRPAAPALPTGGSVDS